MMIVRWSLSGLLLAAGLCSSAHASTILFSTLGNPGDAAKSVSSGVAAESFIATGNGIGDVELALSAPTGSTGGILITIMDDNANKPSGTALYTIATLNEAQIGSTESFYDFYNLSVNTLTAGNRYWIEVGKAGSDQTSAYTTIVAPSTGTASNGTTAGSTNYYAGAGRGANSPLQAMCVSTDNACGATYSSVALSVNEAVAAPEPATMTIFAVGLVALGWSRSNIRRRGRWT